MNTTLRFFQREDGTWDCRGEFNVDGLSTAQVYAVIETALVGTAVAHLIHRDGKLIATAKEKHDHNHNH